MAPPVAPTPLGQKIKILGVDPDMDGTGFALCSLNRIHRFDVARSDGGARGLRAVKAQIKKLAHVITKILDAEAPDEAVIEVPLDREFQRKARPQDLILLGMVSAAVATRLDYEGVKFTLAYPSDWKGSQKKGPNQALFCEHYGLKHQRRPNIDSPVILRGLPPEIDVGEDVTADSYKEILDAGGMSLWKLKGGLIPSWRSGGR